MFKLRQNSISLFRFAGVDVSLHWSWFLVAAYEIGERRSAYPSIVWNIAEYVGLFGIVLLHEYGHSLACRQTGGVADRIVLWPLGGVAYVNPPPRAAAMLWSIAAGPLVNVGLFPVFYAILAIFRHGGLVLTSPNAYALVRAIAITNLVLLIFNLLPIYPLDGGQILRSLLWFVIGRARSLMAAAVLGFVGVAALAYYAIRTGSTWFVFIAAFVLMNCWRGLQQSRALLQLTNLPRHNGFLCPSCNAAPPIGEFWNCSQCGRKFDTFQTAAVCPACAAQFPTTSCMDCGRTHPLPQWAATA